MSDFKIKLGVELDTSDIKSQLNSKKIDPIKVNLDISNVDKQINHIRTQLQSLSKIKIDLSTGAGNKNIGASIQKSINEVTDAYNDLMKLQSRINSTRIKISGLDASKDSKQITELSGQLNRLMTDYNNLYNVFSKSFSVNQLDNLNRSFEITSNKITALNAKIADAKDSLAKDIKLKIDTGKFSNDISNLESKFDGLSNKSNKLRNGIDMVKNALKDMRNASSADELINANKNYERTLKEVNNQLQIRARLKKDIASSQKLVDDRNIFQSKIDAWLKDNSMATKKYGATLLELKAKAESCDKTTLNHLQKEFSQLKQEAETAGLATQNFGDRLRTQFKRYSSYLSIASVFMYTVQGMREMFNQVVAIDSAMTELKKVTDETDATYDRFLSNASSRAQEIGTTIDGLVNSTADFARLGYSFEQSQELAEIANIYAVVGDEIASVEDATKSLVSTMAAYGEQVDAMSMIDKFNEVSNNFSISSGGIGEALQRSASSLLAAGNTLDESIALITASNTVVQDPTMVGTAWKTKFFYCLCVQKCA